MSHINYSFNQTDDSLPRDKMKLRNIASTKYSGDWPSIPHSHSYAELFYIVDGAGQFQINDKLFPVQAHQLVVVNPNVIHTEVSLESHPLEYIVLGIEGLEFTISDAAEGSFCVYTFDGNNDVLPCMRKILTEMQNRCNLVRRTEKGRLRRRGWGLRWEKSQKGGKGTNLRGFFED